MRAEERGSSENFFLYHDLSLAEIHLLWYTTDFFLSLTGFAAVGTVIKNKIKNFAECKLSGIMKTELTYRPRVQRLALLLLPVLPPSCNTHLSFLFSPLSA